MAFGDMFNKKSNPGVPVDRVMQLKGQGMSSTQVTEALQREGYSVDSIFQALNHVEMKGTVEGQPGMPMGQPMMQGNPADQGGQAMFPGQGPGPEPMPYPQPQDMGGMGAPQGYPQPGQMPMGQSGGQPNMSTEATEEIIEAIIDEKWKELVKQVNKIIDWKEKTDQELASLKTSFESLRKDMELMKAGIIDKVGEYDRNIKNVGTDLKALEAVFKDMLPGFTENVQELSRITGKMRNN